MEWDEFTSFIVDNGMHGAEADTYTINQCVGVAVVVAANELLLTQECAPAVLQVPPSQHVPRLDQTLCAH